MKVSLATLALILLVITEAKEFKEKKLLKGSIQSSAPKIPIVDSADLVPFYIVLSDEVAEAAHFIPLNPYDDDLLLIDLSAQNQDKSFAALTKLSSTRTSSSSRSATARALYKTMISTTPNLPTPLNLPLITTQNLNLSRVNRHEISHALQLAAITVSTAVNTSPTESLKNTTRTDESWQMNEASDLKWRNNLPLALCLAILGFIYVI